VRQIDFFPAAVVIFDIARCEQKTRLSEGFAAAAETEVPCGVVEVAEAETPAEIQQEAFAWGRDFFRAGRGGRCLKRQRGGGGNRSAGLEEIPSGHVRAVLRTTMLSQR